MSTCPLTLAGYVPGIRRAPTPTSLASSEEHARATRPRAVVSLVGQRFGRLTVVEFAGVGPSGSRWRCRCECGGRAVVFRVNLVQGVTRSCGCLRAEYQASRAAAR